MIVEMKVPSPGESITEVVIANWLKTTGDYVEKDEEICEIDSDKATLTLNAEESGKLEILVKAGETVRVGEVVCKIDTSAAAPAPSKAREKVGAEAGAISYGNIKNGTGLTANKDVSPAPVTSEGSSYAKGHPSVAAKKILDENNIAPAKIKGTGVNGRITKEDALKALSAGFNGEVMQGWGGTRDTDRQKMSPLRKKIAQRLVAVKNETAMLTTFNEIDMSNVMSLRGKYKDKFKETHGVGLGFMSFFTKAVTEALNLFPAVNAMISGDEIVYHQYADIGIAVSAPKGLMVPIIRNAEQMSLAQIEGAIGELAKKARDGKITVDEMTGGTFTITNGGVFGSLMSTPIINPPQSAILGMHNIVERPVAVNGQVVIRPMMYIALSYDHRIIDGKESVSFLVKVKEMIENPTKLLFGAKDPVEVLLGL